MKKRISAHRICVAIMLSMYVISALTWITVATIRCVKASGLTAQKINAQDFHLESALMRQEPYADFKDPIVSTDPDAQMIYPKPVSLNGLSFRLRGHLPTGTPELYYRKPGGVKYHRVQPVSYDPEDGTYIFDCGFLDQVELRIDPVTTAGCVFEITDLTLNLEKPLWSYFIPTFDTLLLLLGIPAVLSVLAKEILLEFGKKNDKE